MVICGLIRLSAVDRVSEQVGTYYQCFIQRLTLCAPLDDEKSCMLLVMRVLSIVPLNFKVDQMNQKCLSPLISILASAMVRATVTRITGIQFVCEVT